MVLSNIERLSNVDESKMFTVKLLPPLGHDLHVI